MNLNHHYGIAKLGGLDLRRTQVTDVSLAHVTQLPTLESLVVWDTKITDAGVAELQHLQRETNSAPPPPQ